MSRIEPILTDEDREIWALWRETCLLHADTRLHKRRVAKAVESINRALDTCAPWYCAVSAGKDSAVMLRLISSIDPSVRGCSVVDDIEYPGEREQLTALSNLCDVPIEQHSPVQSSWDIFVASNSAIYDNLHDVNSPLSRDVFMPVLSVIESRFQGVFLGLRSEESKHRVVNRAVRGVLYQRKRIANDAKMWTCTPIADWRGLDVYAYAFSHDVPLHPLYQCCALAHRADPSRLRLDWWLPGKHGARGHVQWLRRYYPSLYGKLKSLFADHWQYTALFGYNLHGAVGFAAVCSVQQKNDIAKTA